MTNEELFKFTKNSLRITSTAFDDEIKALTTAATVDISEATDKAFNINDAVQCNAVAVYCQAYFGLGDDKALARYKDMLQAIGIRNMKYSEGASNEG